MRLRPPKTHHKAFKQTSKYKRKRVLNVKPYPIPDLEGQSARVFEENIRRSPTPTQKRIMHQASIVFNQTKRRK